MLDEMETLGQKVHHYRKIKKWSQEKLAEKVGITEPYVSRIESGKSCNLRLDTLLKLSYALGVSIHDLFADMGGSETHLVNRNYYEIMEYLKEQGIESLAVLQYRMSQDDDEQHALLVCRTAKSHGISKDIREIADYELKRRIKTTPQEPIINNPIKSNY